MNYLQKFMYGRYGVDKLTYFLLALGTGFWFLSIIFFSHIFNLFSVVIFGLCLFRILSKNTYKRSQENLLYLSITYKIKTKVKNTYHLLFGTKTHKYYKCPTCSQSLRVPKSKGKITITCPKCKTKFTKTT